MNYETMYREAANIAEAALDIRTHDHLVRMRVDEELREARAMARWWDENPERQQTWPDLYAEHKAVLALVERLAAE